MKVLITGGAGFIGSHTCLELIRSGHEVFVLDSLENGNFESLLRVQRLSNRPIGFSKCDVRDRTALDAIFSEFQPEAVIHFAGLKSVGESLNEPAKYYDVNVGGLAVLLDVMDKFHCQNIVFSSSATVYGIPKYLPCDESHPLDPINPYGSSKLMGEKILQDWAFVDVARCAVALRYFNPVGADFSGIIGEDPNMAPNNLMPFISQVAVGKRKLLEIFGSDYDTVDGSGVRDYIHVVDLASAHVASVENLKVLLGFTPINIGTGLGISVLEMVSEFEIQSGKKVNFKLAARRPGDAPSVWADVSLAKEKIGFIAKFGIVEMCRDTWLWQSKNPDGYK